MATLHHLAPELLTIILRALDSPGDLYALIVASPLCLRLFTSSRAKVLSSVLQNAIQPGSLHHAAAICHVPPPADLQNKRVLHIDMGIPSSALRFFLDQYFSENPLQFPTDIAAITKLCRLQTLVSRFVDEYALRAARLLGTSQDPLQQFPPLSRSERTRLERAFFRFELFSQIFIRETGDYSIDSIFDNRDQLRLFLHRLEPWEVEEMSCIHDYFTFRVGEVLDKLEEQVVCAVLSVPGIQRVGGVRPSSPIPSKWRVRGVVARDDLLDPFPCFSHSIPPQTEDNTVISDSYQRKSEVEKTTPFHNLSLFGLPHFEEHNHHKMPDFISNMTSFGLEHLQKLFLGDDTQRNDMIREHAPFSRDFFPEVPRYSQSMPPRVSPGTFGSPPRAVGETQFDEDPSCQNVGYDLFRTQDRRIYNNGRDVTYCPLRERGYVFWDTSRIQIPSIRRRLEEARDMSSEAIVSTSWLQRKSVEERLRGVELPQSEFRKICKIFGEVIEYSDG
ncbi:uncharacterized protein DNG_04408 [Cephalotrichum gorgonifer]|uniref:Uncharacterized protein n=1 Tax=Cephalotrichum gorgonifer TaxID=2041049 RepID=A0AAE8MYP4_9PEZI|nr:uncharacterized protein DNG_04408 [Cephalotrichum gorgonifer]